MEAKPVINPLPFDPIGGPIGSRHREQYARTMMRLYDHRDEEGLLDQPDPTRSREQQLDVAYRGLELRLIISRELIPQRRDPTDPESPTVWMQVQHVRAVNMSEKHRTVGTICQYARLLLDELRQEIRQPILEHNTEAWPILMYHVKPGDLPEGAATPKAEARADLATSEIDEEPTEDLAAMQERLREMAATVAVQVLTALKAGAEEVKPMRVPSIEAARYTASVIERCMKEWAPASVRTQAIVRKRGVTILTTHTLSSGAVAIPVGVAEEPGSGEMDAPPPDPEELHPALRLSAIEPDLQDLAAGDVDAIVWHIDRTQIEELPLNAMQGHLEVALAAIRRRGFKVVHVEHDGQAEEINVEIERA